MLIRTGKLRFLLLPTAVAFVVIAADRDWKVTPTAAWTEDDARQILTDSPWSKTVTATIRPLQTEDERREGGNMGQEHGIGFDGIADDRPRMHAPKSIVDIVKPEAAVAPPTQSIKLQLRWESALPIRIAVLKSRDTTAPSVSDGSYTLAVYGIPDAHFQGGDPTRLGGPLKTQAVLRRDGKKDVRPSSVKVFEGQDGLVALYLFPLAAEISKNDRQIEFDAKIGRISIVKSFDLDDMQLNGKLEL